jgi:uncharacterized membrane protein
MAGLAIARVRHRVRRHILARPRLLVSAAVGIATALAIPDLSPTHRAVVGWDCAIVTFLGLIVVMAARADQASMRRRAALEYQGGWAFLALMATAAFFSSVQCASSAPWRCSATGKLQVEYGLTAYEDPALVAGHAE